MIDTWQQALLNPKTAIGAATYALVFLGFALVLGAIVRKVARRVEPHLSDVTALRRICSLVQAVAFIVCLGLYAHSSPSLRALGTALLAGVSVVSVVLELAAQNTLGDLNASMIFGGMGPVAELKTDSGKLFAGVYALFSGLFFLVIAGLILGPIVHRLLHKFHFDADTD